MNIYLPTSTITRLPKHFEAIAIPLDARRKSLLEWHNAIKEANKWIVQNARLFWMLEMDLFDLCKATDANAQILMRAIEHFEQVVWNPFKEWSVGVCLYQGSCQLDDFQVAFLEQLSGSLPDDAEPFLMLDGSMISNPILAARSLSKERFPHFTLAVKGIDHPLQEFGWELKPGPKGYIGQNVVDHKFNTPKVGVCIPYESSSDALEKIIVYLQENKIAFRLIPEAHITSDWEGLDEIIVDASLLAGNSRRKLMGFCAAGGVVVALGQHLQLPLEIGVDEWKRNLSLS